MRATPERRRRRGLLNDPSKCSLAVPRAASLHGNLVLTTFSMASIYSANWKARRLDSGQNVRGLASHEKAYLEQCGRYALEG
jgi:hypothetical protein